MGQVQEYIDKLVNTVAMGTIIRSRAFEQSSIIEYPPSQAPPVGIPAAEGSSNFFGLAGPAGGLALPPR